VPRRRRADEESRAAGRGAALPRRPRFSSARYAGTRLGMTYSCTPGQPPSPTLTRSSRNRAPSPRRRHRPRCRDARGARAPRHFVDLGPRPRRPGAHLPPDGGLRIGASVRVTTLARDPRIRALLGVLAEACEGVGTTALRTMGTIAGNLCQRPRCWSLQSRIACYERDGKGCPASRKNQHLSGDPCYMTRLITPQRHL
jgi:hypothetical protein